MNSQVLFVYGTRTCLGNTTDDEVRRVSCRADTLAAARELGFSTAILSPLGACAPSDPANRVVTADLRHPEEAVEVARKLHAEQPLAAVFGCEEDALVTSAMIAEEFGLSTHPVHAAFAAMDKPTMKERFRAAGVPTAEFTLAADEDDAVRWAARTGYPVVVKPCRSGASQGVIRADDEEQLRAAYRRLRRIVRDYGLDHGGRPASMQLVERYVDGPEVSCELIVQDGEPEPFAIFEKPLPLTGPFFEETMYLTPPALPVETQRAIEEVAIAAARAIGLRQGPAHCELRLTDSGPFVVEIAGRYLGALCTWVFKDRLGEDIQPYFMKVALGEKVQMPKPLPDAPATGAMILPIPGEGRLVAVYGADRARRVPGIRECITIACAGDILVPFPEQTCYPLGFLTAAGPTREAVIDSLTWAAGSISVEVAPTGCDRWVRPIEPSDAAYEPPDGYTPLALADLAPDEARALVAEYLAEIMYDELPHDEALSTVTCSIQHEEATRGERAWVGVEGKGFFLGFVKGQEGYMGCGGVFPEHRRSGIGEIVARLQLAEFARRGCTTAVSETDPRLPLMPPLLRALGFRLQPSAAAEEPTQVLSCSLSALERRRADAQPAGATTAGGSDCCCECPS